jgi:hypothetical protein
VVFLEEVTDAVEAGFPTSAVFLEDVTDAVEAGSADLSADLIDFLDLDEALRNDVLLTTMVVFCGSVVVYFVCGSVLNNTTIHKLCNC